MVSITAACAETGNCSLQDIMQVFYNIGNYILAIIGSLVLLMYIIGGVYYLTSGGDSGKVSKGTKYITVSTFGLLIVLFAYAGVKTLESVIRQQGQIASEEYVVCGPGSFNEGNACGMNMICTEDGQCITECQQNHPSSGWAVDEMWDCFDTSAEGFSASSCQQGLCPGSDAVQCCNLKL
ncbi:MAG: hypothetical protein UU08_C0009G0026 [Candidatus Uhrbacteria bacterium GW2011_GWE2_40_58]|nr:MAG: hypothetical protein UT94_C0030G0010 [Candidatus Uhrbacteria bacterium GW2011_GWF2_40_263]KKR67764.1 MAG: hypothetical protein UU08_C0009G0026 [Candidatus Uhrbacteria bacterium GW2011_GWE2_40_58]